MAKDPSREPGADDARAARAVMNRAIRRLNVLESLILGAAGLAAIAGGWLAALLSRSAFGFPFRITWLASSVLLFVIPGALAWTMERRGRRQAPNKDSKETRDDAPGRGGG